jgi:hypothetical protein
MLKFKTHPPSDPLIRTAELPRHNSTISVRVRDHRDRDHPRDVKLPPVFAMHSGLMVDRQARGDPGPT